MTLVMKFTTRLSWKPKPNRKPRFFRQNLPKPTDRKHFETVTTLITTSSKSGVITVSQFSLSFGSLAFSALMLLVVWHKGHPPVKKLGKYNRRIQDNANPVTPRRVAEGSVFVPWRVRLHWLYNWTVSSEHLCLFVFFCFHHCSICFLVQCNKLVTRQLLDTHKYSSSYRIRIILWLWNLG